MRYEFEKEGATVASVLWEGPGQVSVETDDPTTRRPSTGTCRPRSRT